MKIGRGGPVQPNRAMRREQNREAGQANHEFEHEPGDKQPCLMAIRDDGGDRHGIDGAARKNRDRTEELGDQGGTNVGRHVGADVGQPLHHTPAR